ncbi:hypothetical protein Dimus_016310, partial [Dionaea muscipula]
MDYVINTPHHELPYGELLTRIFHAFDVPLNDIEGEQPVKTDHYDETFFRMCGLRRENSVWWLGSGDNRRRDEEDNDQESEGEEASEDDKGDSEETETDDTFGESTPIGSKGEQTEQV